MARCEKCEKLVDASSSVEPHDELRELEHVEYRGDGNRRATSIRYRCTACRTPWERDMDRRDAGANWSIDRRED